jgi:hypothetical protein
MVDLTTERLSLRLVVTSVSQCAISPSYIRWLWFHIWRTSLAIVAFASLVTCVAGCTSTIRHQLLVLQLASTCGLRSGNLARIAGSQSLATSSSSHRSHNVFVVCLTLLFLFV